MRPLSVNVSLLARLITREAEEQSASTRRIIALLESNSFSAKSFYTGDEVAFFSGFEQF